MSLSSELTDLTTNLSAAKAAVVTKGGTVGDTGLAGLSTEIATIPMPVTYDYGTVTVGERTITGSVTSQTNCTATITDVNKIAALLLRVKAGDLQYTNGESVHTATFTYSTSGGWYISTGREVYYTNIDDLANNGLSIVQPSFSVSASVAIRMVIEVDPANTRTLHITDISDFRSLGYADYTYSNGGGFNTGPLLTSYSINGETGYKPEILSYTAGPDATELPDAFLSNCYYIEDIDLTGVEKIGGYFLSFCTPFNEQITIPSTVRTIGQYFMYCCSSFNQPITIPSTVTKIDRSFLSRCSSFNSTVTINAQVPSLQYFLSDCTVFNQPITIPSSVTDLEGFLYYCPAFNQSLQIPSGVKNFNSFLYHCTSFNKAITFPESGENFYGCLGRCAAFNQPINVPSAAKNLGNFLSDSTAFNSSVTISSQTECTIGSNFLANCSAFNQPITIPAGCTIGWYFLANCTSFNSTVSISAGVTSIGAYFLNNCTSFNHDITLPSSITTIDVSYFMWCCNKMVSTVYVNTNATVSSSNYVLSTNSSSALCYTTGIKVGGTYGSNWRSTFANRTKSPYRKLIAA